MNFIFQTPSLQHLLFMQISGTLWNFQDDIWTELASYRHKHPTRASCDTQELRLLTHTNWKKILDKVSEKVRALPIPEECKQRIQHFLEPVGREMYAWFQHHYEGENDDLFHSNIPIQLFWTARGTIDSRRTAALLVQNKNLSLKKRYQLACMNCLESDIRQLYISVPETHKKKFLEASPSGRQYVWALPYFWTRLLSDKDEFEDYFYNMYDFSFDQSAYYFAAGKSPVATSEYFFKKLSLREKREVLVTDPPIFPHNHLNIPVIVTYLSQISLKQQELYFEIAAGDVLVLFLNWPWQALFMEAAKHLWPFVNQRFYNDVLSELGEKISRCSADYNYFHLFREFCTLSRSRFQEFLQLPCFLLKQIFDSKEEELIKFILEEANDEQKRRFEPHVQQFFGPNGFRHYDHAPIIQFLMDESIVSNETLIKCRRNFELDYLKEQEECQTLKFDSYEKRWRFVVIDCMVQMRSNDDIMDT